MTPEQEQLRDAFLAECWAPVREVPYGERVAKRKADRDAQRRAEESAIEAASAQARAAS